MHHNLSDHLIDLLENIYTNNAIDVDTLTVANQLLQAMRLEPNANAFCAPKNLWSEQDVVLITYGNTIKNDETNHLSALKRFTDEHCKNITNTLHILPFFPASADAGFAVKDYRAVDPTLGSWQDIENLCVDYHVMADLVINHGSKQSEWFEQFCLANPTYKDFTTQQIRKPTFRGLRDQEPVPYLPVLKLRMVNAMYGARLAPIKSISTLKIQRYY